MSKYLCRHYTKLDRIYFYHYTRLNRMLLYRLLLLYIKKPFRAALRGEHQRNIREIFDKYLINIVKDPVAPYHIKYTKNCQVPKEGHLGQFPANFCVKLKGTNGNMYCNSANCNESWPGKERDYLESPSKSDFSKLVLVFFCS